MQITGLKVFFLRMGRISDIRKGLHFDDSRVIDIVPTVLHMFGLPIPKDIDGRVLGEIFSDHSALKTKEIKYVPRNYYISLVERTKIRTKIKKLKASGKI